MSKAVGIVLVFLDEKGHAIAGAADFDRSTPGGCELSEGQRYRARLRLAFAVCNAYASPMLTRGLDSYDCERIVDRLVQMHGCKVREVLIGHKSSSQASGTRTR